MPKLHMKNEKYCYYECPIGTLKVAEDDDGITEVSFCEQKEEDHKEGSRYLDAAMTQLEEYFAEKRHEFDLPLSLKGTDFQMKVWNALMRIPYGETRSYREIAEAAGNPKAVRAVGGANHRNPVVIIVPCHRVINADGSIGGYGAGIDRKKYLLKLEESGIWK